MSRPRPSPAKALLWEPAPCVPTLGPGELHVWAACPQDGDPGADGALLAPGEAERAGRFVQDRDRRRFVARRALLRRLLGAYLDADPAAIGVREGGDGKPRLRSSPDREGLEFNLSHSEGLVLVAVARDVPVGVDVERVRPLPEARELARAHFAPEEVEALAAVQADERSRAFLTCWTRKEAVVKARGGGLSLPLDDFVVGVDPEAPERTVPLDGPSGDEGWTLSHLDPAEGWVGALAAPRPGLDVVRRRWT